MYALFEELDLEAVERLGGEGVDAKDSDNEAESMVTRCDDGRPILIGKTI